MSDSLAGSSGGGLARLDELAAVAREYATVCHAAVSLRGAAGIGAAFAVSGSRWGLAVALEWALALPTACALDVPLRRRRLRSLARRMAFLREYGG